MQVREATQADLLYMKDRSISMGCADETPEQIDYVYAVEHEGDVLYVGGFKLMTATTAWCWMDWTEKALKHKKMAYRIAKEWIDEWIVIMGIRLLLASIRTDVPEAIRTIEHLGFSRDYIMKQFYGDKDAYMYSRIVRSE